MDTRSKTWIPVQLRLVSSGSSGINESRLTGPGIYPLTNHESLAALQDSLGQEGNLDTASLEGIITDSVDGRRTHNHGRNVAGCDDGRVGFNVEGGEREKCDGVDVSDIREDLGCDVAGGLWTCR